MLFHFKVIATLCDSQISNKSSKLHFHYLLQENLTSNLYNHQRTLHALFLVPLCVLNISVRVSECVNERH